MKRSILCVLACAALAAATPAESVSEQAAAMSLEQRIAQLMLTTLHGRQGPDRAEQALLAMFRVGGVLTPPPRQPAQAAQYVSALRQEGRRSTIPLFIGVDLRRTGETPAGPMHSYLHMPTPLAVAATGDPHAERAVAEAAAAHLAAMGFNMWFAPSLAVAPLVSAGEDGLDDLYGYGGNPEFAGAAGAAFISALDEAGILAVARDFPAGPGLGGGMGLPVLAASENLIVERCLPPFEAAIAAGVPAMHLANTIVPAFSPDNLPVPFASYAVQTLLRDHMGFEGLVVAGPMDDPGLAPYANPVQACIAALNAGADMLYWQGRAPMLEQIIPALVEAVKNGVVSEDRINQAVVRILERKQALNLAERPLPSEKVAERLLRDRQSVARLDAIGRQSLTLVKNEGAVLPLTRDASAPVLVTGIAGVHELHEQLSKPLRHVGKQPLLTVRHVGAIEDFEIQRAVRQATRARTTIVVLGAMVGQASQRDLLRQIKATETRVVLIYLGHPAALHGLQEADAVVAVYVDPRTPGRTFDALAKLLLGEAAVAVEPPASPLRVVAGEEVAFSAVDWMRAPAGRLPVDVDASLLAGTAVGYDLGQAVKNAAWTFGDGGRKRGLTVAHRFKEPGRYAVTLTITDTSGEKSEGRALVIVE